ncbi:GMC family oxidoreductase [Pseudooceanicola sp.]|uniref:GMC family oxidoreductase n=1 Tax=Pseudooceanicola sp. TaxID=1914328 RepID=UPI0035C68F37
MSDGCIIETDIVIVGAGSAGSVLAGRLSERSATRVTVVEAGGSDASPWVWMPIGYGGAFYHPRLNWRYYTEAEPELGGRQAYWPRGRVLGGSSAINAMVYVRGQARDYDQWAEAGCDGWSYHDLLPYFRRMESYQGGPDQWRGGAGPVHVRDIDADAHGLSHAYLAAAQAAGHEVNPDYNGADQEGVALYQINTRGGFRCSAARAYLRPAMKRANLRVVRDALVARVLFDGRRAVGVELTQKGRPIRIMAREVVLAAGAIGSPAILQRSGVGDPQRLADLGIETVHSAPGVGRNLQDHLGFDIAYLSRTPTLNRDFGTWRGRMLAGMRYLLTRGGPLALSVNQGGGFVRSTPEHEVPNIQLYFSPMSYTRARPGKRRLMAPDSFQGFMLGASNCHPKSRGWLHIRSADPSEAPEMHGNYLSAPEDLEELIAAFPLLRAIAAQPPLADHIERELRPGDGATDRAAMESYIRDTAGSVFHQCGTCAMGPDAARGAVVAPDLKVHGLAGLRVADASIIPVIPSGNINAPAMMIGEKAADLIAGRG